MLRSSVRAIRLAPVNLVLLRTYAAKNYPKHIRIPMPALSPTMTSGNIGKWSKIIGDKITPGDVLVEIETDKATMDFEVQEEGFLAKRFIESGAKDVPVNKLLAILAENKADVAAFEDYPADDSGSPSTSPATAVREPTEQTTTSGQAPAAPLQPTTPPSDTKPSSSAPSPAPSTDRILVSPVAKKIAEERGIPLSAIKGTGPNGRIIKEDVVNYVAPASQPETTAAPAPAAPSPKPSAVDAEYTDIPLTKMREVIAKRLTESKQQLPHFYLTVDIKVDAILALRASLNEKAKDKYKLSVNDFVIKAASKALQEVPEANSGWMGTFIRKYHNSDISVAVATPSGLITPIIFKAETKGLAAISEQMKKLAAKARDGKLTPNEYQGGSFSISNLGMFGIREFTAIINPPQSCILAVGSVEKRLIPSEKTQFETASIMTVTLSCDHRVVDGAVGAQWLQAFRSYMEDPITLLL